MALAIWFTLLEMAANNRCNLNSSAIASRRSVGVSEVAAASADSSQYNLLTWAAWVMANASMTASIYESNGRKLTNLVLVNAGNTLMCLVTMAVIWYYRH